MNKTFTSIKVENQNFALNESPNEVTQNDASLTLNTPLNDATWTPINNTIIQVDKERSGTIDNRLKKPINHEVLKYVNDPSPKNAFRNELGASYS